MPHERERQRFLETIRDRGLRVTRARLSLFDQIFTQHGHIDAEELLAAARLRGLAISRATVYRNLDLLVDCGLVRKHRLGHRRFLYEHVHAGQDHDHLVCSDCGRVVEFVSPGIAALQTEICRAHGFLPSHHTLQITGLCTVCAAAAAERPAAHPRLEAAHV
jgi:Fur family transcriptional regulator, ferric uptake regulator